MPGPSRTSFQSTLSCMRVSGICWEMHWGLYDSLYKVAEQANLQGGALLKGRRVVELTHVSQSLALWLCWGGQLLVLKIK